MWTCYDVFALVIVVLGIGFFVGKAYAHQFIKKTSEKQRHGALGVGEDSEEK